VQMTWKLITTVDDVNKQKILKCLSRPRGVTWWTYREHIPVIYSRDSTVNISLVHGTSSVMEEPQAS
jgi:hypothetical protein